MCKVISLVLIFMVIIPNSALSMKAQNTKTNTSTQSAQYIYAPELTEKKLQENGLKLDKSLKPGKKIRAKIQNKFPFLLDEERDTIILEQKNGDYWYLQKNPANVK